MYMQTRTPREKAVHATQGYQWVTTVHGNVHWKTLVVSNIKPVIILQLPTVKSVIKRLYTWFCSCVTRIFFLIYIHILVIAKSLLLI